MGQTLVHAKKAHLGSFCSSYNLAPCPESFLSRASCYLSIVGRAEESSRAKMPKTALYTCRRFPTPCPTGGERAVHGLAAEHNRPSLRAKYLARLTMDGAGNTQLDLHLVVLSLRVVCYI